MVDSQGVGPVSPQSWGNQTGSVFLHSAPADIFTPEELTAEARMIGRSMEEYVRREVSPIAGRLDVQEAGLMPDLVRRAGKLGLLGASMPRRYGGLDVDKTTAAFLAEKSGIDLAFAITIGVHSGVAALPLLLFGTDAQRDRYLPGIATGETIAAFALSEGNSGSDALAAQATAVLRTDKQGRLYHDRYCVVKHCVLRRNLA